MDWDDLFNAPFPSAATSTWDGSAPFTPDADIPAFDSEPVKSSSSSGSADSQRGRSLPSTPLAQDETLEHTSQTAVIRRRPIPRKGHTKSRRGCFSCKKRKIKCQETLPKCGNCIKSGVHCHYPIAPTLVETTISAPAPILQPQATPTVFSMEDMRFFHHFLVRAYPHLPVGGDNIWTLEIPAYAHKYDFLLRSMLALGASHLSVFGPSSQALKFRALTHRGEAVKLLNASLSRPAENKYEADARFAALMILTFQSSCMSDGLFDFLTMLRGCILQGDLDEDSYFTSFMQGRHIETMEDKFKSLAIESLGDEAVDAALASLRRLLPYCQEGIEMTYHGLLTKIFQKAYTSPSNAYRAFVDVYNLVGIISHAEFQHMIDSSNGIAQILISHFLASHILLRPIAMEERAERDASPLFKVLESWVFRIHAELDPSLQRLHNWPITFVQSNAPWVDPKVEALLDRRGTKYIDCPDLS